MRNPFRQIRWEKTETEVEPTDSYLYEAYCCICNSGYGYQRFKVRIPRGLIPEGREATCPHCGCVGEINDYGQLWPKKRGR